MRSLTALALVVLAAIAPTAWAAPPLRPASPVRLDRAAADSLRRAIAAGREETRQWLAGGATSYLATTQRVDFGARTRLTLGSDGDNDVRLTAAGIAPHHLGIEVVGDSFLVAAIEPGATFGAGRDSVLTHAVLPPSSIRVGRFTVRLSHQRYPALIVFDPRSPRLAGASGPEYHPVDMAYRFEVPLTPNPAPDTTIIQSTRGTPRRAVLVGWFDVRIGRRPVRLEAHRLLEPGVGENAMSVFFRDATTGRGSYEVGRYLDPEPLPGGRFLLDFNLAYNPACAYSEHYNCPIPSRANNLRVAIRAGERDPGAH